MAIAFRAASTASGTSSASLAVPAGTAVGDVLIAWKLDRATSGTTTAPAGWTRISSASGTSGRGELFYRVHDTSNTGPWSFTGSTRTLVACCGFTGCDTVTPLDVTPSIRYNASGTTGAPTITPASSGAMLLACFGSLTANYTWSAEATANIAAANWTERTDTAYSTYLDAAVASYLQPAATTTGASSATMSTAGNNAGALVAIRPAPSVTVTDTAGSTEEATASIPASDTASDAAGAGETVLSGAEETDADAAGSSEEAIASAVASVADAAGTGETAAASAKITVTETAQGTDSETTSASYRPTDFSGTGEAQAWAVAVSPSEAAGSSDMATASARDSATATDTAGASDAATASTPSASASATDTAGSAEAQALLHYLTVNDVAASTEFCVAEMVFPVSDTAGTDEQVSFWAALFAIDASGSDEASTTAGFCEIIEEAGSADSASGRLLVGHYLTVAGERAVEVVAVDGSAGEWISVTGSRRAYIRQQITFKP